MNFYFVDLVSVGLSCVIQGLLYSFSPALIFVFSVLAQRLAGKSVYLVSVER